MTINLFAWVHVRSLPSGRGHCPGTTVTEPPHPPVEHRSLPKLRHSHWTRPRQFFLVYTLRTVPHPHLERVDSKVYGRWYAWGRWCVQLAWWSNHNGVSVMANLRIAYIAGPGDVIGTYRYWQRGEDDPRMPDVAYSYQFYDVCKRFGARALVIGTNKNAQSVCEGPFQIEHRPIPFAGSRRSLSHAGLFLYCMGLVQSVVSFRADFVVFSSPSYYWFVMALPAALGIKVVPAIHGNLWLPSKPQTLSVRVFMRLARGLFARHSVAVLSHPGTNMRQVEMLTRGKHRPLVPFIPYYRKEAFAQAPEHSNAERPFRVLFVGRVERFKGVFDLLKIAYQLRELNRKDIEFDVCGTGSALEQLRAEAGIFGVGFRCHGRVEMATLRDMFGRCHVVIVPTRKDYDEGFNAVVAEAVLSGRPVITSRLCPAIDLVRDAAVQVDPEDLEGYRAAILKLCDKAEFYESKQKACADLQAQFYDSKRSWGSGLSTIIEQTLAAESTRGRRQSGWKRYSRTT